MSRNVNFLRYDVEANFYIHKAFIEAEGYPVLCVETTRTDAEQLRYYNEGKSDAKTPSFHSEHAGLAYDICLNVVGREYSDVEFWESAGRIGKAIGFTWGGDWKSLVDKPHFQWDAHGKYTGAMVRSKQYPPPMPPFDGAVPFPAIPTSRPLLKKGHVMREVERLQKILNRLGFKCGVPDGIFGVKTDAAVRAFQSDAKIGVDGIVGPVTWAALAERMKNG